MATTPTDPISPSSSSSSVSSAASFATAPDFEARVDAAAGDVLRVTFVPSDPPIPPEELEKPFFFNMQEVMSDGSTLSYHVELKDDQKREAQRIMAILRRTYRIQNLDDLRNLRGVRADGGSVDLDESEHVQRLRALYQDVTKTPHINWPQFQPGYRHNLAGRPSLQNRSERIKRLSSLSGPNFRQIPQIHAVLNPITSVNEPILKRLKLAQDFRDRISQHLNAKVDALRALRDSATGAHIESANRNLARWEKVKREFEALDSLAIYFPLTRNPLSPEKPFEQSKNEMNDILSMLQNIIQSQEGPLEDTLLNKWGIRSTRDQTLTAHEKEYARDVALFAARTRQLYQLHSEPWGMHAKKDPLEFAMVLMASERNIEPWLNHPTVHEWMGGLEGPERDQLTTDMRNAMADVLRDDAASTAAPPAVPPTSTSATTSLLSPLLPRDPAYRPDLDS